MLWLAQVGQRRHCLCGHVTAVGNIEGVGDTSNKTARLSFNGSIQMSHTHTGEYATLHM